MFLKYCVIIIDYLSIIKDLNFDIAGDYLYMATTLILLKSKTVIEGVRPGYGEKKAEGDLIEITNNVIFVSNWQGHET